MGHDFWSVILICALAGWIISTLFFAFRAFPEQGRFQAGAARIWGGAVLFFFAVWLLGLVMA